MFRVVDKVWVMCSSYRCDDFVLVLRAAVDVRLRLSKLLFEQRSAYVVRTTSVTKHGTIDRSAGGREGDRRCY